MTSRTTLLVLALCVGLTLSQQQPSTVCPSGCADCRTDLGQTSCYACYRSSLSNGQCSGPAPANCQIVDSTGQCTTCERGFALDTTVTPANCQAQSTIAGCVLEYVATPNKCIVCDGGYPSDDLTQCTQPGDFDPDCLWGTVLQQCIRCNKDNLMAAAAGECVGRYLYGCLQENGIGRCNGCDMDNGFYMKFGTMCWHD